MKHDNADEQLTASAMKMLMVLLIQHISIPRLSAMPIQNPTEKAYLKYDEKAAI